MNKTNEVRRLKRKLKALKVERAVRVHTNMPVGVPLNRQIRKVCKHLKAATS